MTTTLTVGTVDLRQALTACVEHAAKPADDLPDLTRVRLTIGRDHVFVSASDRFTMGLSVVSTWDHHGEECEVVEISTDDVAKILRVFRAPGKEGDESPQYMLRLDVADDTLTITDVSGLGIVGRKFEMPRLETAVTLNSVPRLFEQAHAGQVVLLDETTRMVVSGRNLARFKIAAAVYGDTLTMETRSGYGRGKALILVRCGESHLGLLVPRTQLEGDIQQAREWAEGWEARLPALLAGTESVVPS